MVPVKTFELRQTHRVMIGGEMGTVTSKVAATGGYQVEVALDNGKTLNEVFPPDHVWQLGGPNS